MGNERITSMLEISKDISKARAKLDKLNSGYISRMPNGSATRARTTTYNARAGMEAAYLHEKRRELARIAREALHDGLAVPSSVLSAVGSGIDYDEHGN